MKNYGIRQKAFTLVELLVVIAVIALLLAMLMPALNAARERARQVVCLANIRQLGMATQMYASATGYLPIVSEFRNKTCGSVYDHYASNDPIAGPGSACITDWVDDWFDPCCFGTPGSALIKNGDLDDPTIFDGACPSSKSTIRLSYGYNYGQLGSASRPGKIWYKDGEEWVKITQVQIPAETGMFCDGATGWGHTDRPWGNKPPRTGSWGIAFWEPSFWPDVKPGDDEYEPGYGQYQIIGHRHGTSINLNFVDGHGTSMPPELLHSVKTYGGDKYHPQESYGVYIWKCNKDYPGNEQPAW